MQDADNKGIQACLLIMQAPVSARQVEQLSYLNDACSESSTNTVTWGFGAVMHDR